MRTAHCSCGQLQIMCEGNPEKVSACYCRECQRRTGSAFGVAVFFTQKATKVTGSSSSFTRIGDSGLPVVHHFCLYCGSTVYWYPAKKPGQVAVAIGCFADKDFPAPSQAVFEHRQPAWVTVTLAPK
ncbi:MAG: GFA family protein [Chelatococcus sp.]|nr:GFA family protein [Chelatococcus sp.]MBX3536421.1 GFA family protein [Chelatococcus sp.]